VDASFDHNSPLREIVPGRFARVSVKIHAGEIEARLSERGNWGAAGPARPGDTWRLVCTGDLDCRIVTAKPVAAVQEEVIKNNWPDFEPFLQSQDWAKGVLDQIERSRHVIMHSGALDAADIERLGMNIRTGLNKWGRRR
jgi:hypothetical protein